MKIIIARTDSIGDVILTLPLCGWIKQNIPRAEVYFLCQALTVEIVKKSSFVDKVVVWNGTLPDGDIILHVFPNIEIAKSAKRKKIKQRIGTSHRLFHLITCNRLINFSRFKSPLHESQLNFKLLNGLDIDLVPSLENMLSFIGWRHENEKNYPEYIVKSKFNLIFHIKSRGSAKEWKAENYLKLAKRLPRKYFNIILTGTEHEGKLISNEIPEIFQLANTCNSVGKLSLSELIGLIGTCDGLLACSTGPLHIAGVSNIHCLGLYPQKRPMHAGRWRPIGTKSEFIEEKTISKEKFLAVDVDEVHERIVNWIK